MTALLDAIETSNSQDIARLLGDGAKLGEKEFEAGLLKSASILRLLIDAVDPHARWSEPALYQLVDVYGGPNEAAALRLLERGVDPDGRSKKSGESALHAAITKGSLPLVQALLERGANVEATNERGETPLHLAAAYDARVVRLLLERGARVDASTKEGLTPLHLADGDQVARFLIAKGADVHAPGLFHALVGSVSGALLRELLDAGVDSSVDPGRGLVFSLGGAPHVADGVALLVRLGHDVDAVDSQGSTALHEACLCEEADLANALLDAGASVELRDSDGESALDKWIERIEDSNPAMLAVGDRIVAAVDKVSKEVRRRIERLRAKIANQRKKIAAFDWKAFEAYVGKVAHGQLAELARSVPASEPFSAFCFDCNLGEGEILLCLATVDEHPPGTREPSPGGWRLQGFAELTRDSDRRLGSMLRKLEFNDELDVGAFEDILEALARVALQLHDAEAFARLPITGDFQLFVIEHNEPESAAVERMARVRGKAKPRAGSKTKTKPKTASKAKTKPKTASKAKTKPSKARKPVSKARKPASKIKTARK